MQNSHVNLRLAQLGLPCPSGFEESEPAQLAAPLLARQRELSRRLSDRYCAADQRIQSFLDSYLEETGLHPNLPKRTFVLDEPGLGRALSLPYDSDSVVSPRLSSYRVANGVLHNPLNDRRTTAGVFHVVEGGLPIPDDKIAVSKKVFARLVELAFQPPVADMILPYTANQEKKAACYVSLLLRPLVSPVVPGFVREHRMEVRFIAPGSLVSNLDFVEGVFGNWGDPYLPENDSSLKPQNWTGHTGCVILAPHLTSVTKSSLGLPKIEDATPRQRRDGMCWESEDELYNGGQAFKVCARDDRGVIVTVIADNYYGYCKKEVKTQISYSANLFGNAEEEHAGGARVYPSYDLGQEYLDDSAGELYRLEDVVAREPERFIMQVGGYALDTKLPNVTLVPGNSRYSLRTRSVSWSEDTVDAFSLPLVSGRVYIGPNGYQVSMRTQPTDAKKWTLVGTNSHSTVCHKPATVSGGGKSEISKSIADAFTLGRVYVADFDADMDAVAAILAHDCLDCYADPNRRKKDRRPILSDKRSLGSLIKLLTPSADFTDEHNQWLATIPQHVIEIIYVIKRYYRAEWGEDWRSHFSVGNINGRKGNTLRLDGDEITVNMLRVGFEPDGAWRLFDLRHDFFPATKVQTEDDISASTVVSGDLIGLDGHRSYKLVENCEALLFQRPDDAIHRGYDKQTELDMSGNDVFMSNFQPLTRGDVRAMVDDAPNFSSFTNPMARKLRHFVDGEGDISYCVSSANPRLVDGKPSKNPRYLQNRPDLVHAKQTAIANLASHLVRRLPTNLPLPLPVDVVAAGRRDNPAEVGVPPLTAFSPLHYMELPELFMEFISSMTGKSPSTTGAGSEGALTKGPFNAMPAVFDLNGALLSYILTGYDGWLSCAGYIGPFMRVDHDFSMLVPEVFSRMSPNERKASNLIAEGSLERVEDMEFEGKPVLSSRLGYRMTAKFVRQYFGRIFLYPLAVFTAPMLKPELQDMETFAKTVEVMVETHERVAQAYFADGTIEGAVPPLRALLEIMAHGESAEGWHLDTPEFRNMFSRETVLASDWYIARLDAKRAAALARSEAGLAAIEHFAAVPGNEEPSARLGIPERIAAAKFEIARFQTDAYWSQIVGTTGGESSSLLVLSEANERAKLLRENDGVEA